MFNKSISRSFTLIFTLAMTLLAGSQAVMAAGGPKLGAPGGGPVIDKSQDSGLQNLIKEVAPQFAQHEFTDGQAKMSYNLYTPKNLDAGKKYPLILFMADASTPGEDVKRPLLQGYGALVWASQEFQAKHPCFVLVPQFAGVAVNDAYEHTPEVELILKLLANITQTHPVDSGRLYTTGQSMGGMISMYFNIAHPDIFAASLFVDCHWDTKGFDELVKHPFILVYAGEKGKSWNMVKAVEDAARRMGVGYAWSEWSARLPEQRQNELAATELEKGNPINLIGFENGTVLPDSGRGSEHMYSFDYAYKLAPVRDWLFKYHLEKPAILSVK